MARRLGLAFLLTLPLLTLLLHPGLNEVQRSALADDFIRTQSVGECGTGGLPNVVGLANPNYYVDFGLSPRIDSNYAGYMVRAGTSSVVNPRLVLSGFTGGSIGLALGQRDSIAFSTLPAGGTHTSYFLLQASALTTAPQTHTVTLFSGPTALCQRTFTFNRVADTIKANANKVRNVSADVPSEVSLGDVVTVTVLGDTGVLGAGPSFDPGILSYAPTAFSDFPASAWRLERTEMVISPDGSLPAQTYVDRLFLAGASGSDRPYTAKYTFRAVGPSSTAANVLPVQYIASGTQVKHTSVSSIGVGALPPVSASSSLSLAKSANVSEFPLDGGGDPTGGTVTYTVIASNSGGSSGTIDEFIDTLPAGVTFSAGTATINNRSNAPLVTGTVATGQTLTWYGPFSVPAGGQLRVVYSVEIPAVPGTYSNSVIGRYGGQVIDASESLDASTPATANVVVKALAGSGGGSLAVPELFATTPAGQSVDITSSDPNVTISALATSPLNGTATINNGVLTYAPVAGFVGSDVFEYVGTDGTDTGTNTVTVTVTSVDLIARPNFYTVAVSGRVIENVCANDSVQTEPCIVVSNTSPSVGTFSLSQNGLMDYTAPGGNPPEQVEFSYTIGEAGATSSASVVIFITPRTEIYRTGTYATEINLGVVGGNSTAIDGLPSYGTAAAASGVVTYKPNPLPPGLSDRGFWGIDFFTYKETGRKGPVRVLVGPPTLTIPAQAGQAVSKSLTDTTFLATQVTPITFIVNCPGCLFEVSTSAQHGVFSLNGNTGAFTYLANEGTTASADTVVLKITDTASPSDKNMFVFGTINFTISEFVEVVANDDTVTALAGAGAVTFNVTVNDACPGGCDVVTNGALTEVVQTSTTGAFTFTPGVTLGAQTFTYTLRSITSPAVTDTAIVTVIVEGAVSDSATTAPGQQVSIPVLTNDPCSGLVGVNCVLDSVTGVAVGTATISGSAVLFTPPVWFAGATNFTYVVRATNGSTSSAQVTVNVIKAEDDTFTVSSNTPTTLDPLANDLCADCRITSANSGSIEDDGFGLQVTVSANTTLTYEITDGNGATSSATVSLTVAEPPIAVNDEVTTSAGVAVTVDVLANDKRTSGEANCTTSCSAEVFSDPANGSVSLRADGSLQYTPRADFAGVDSFVYLVINDFGLTATATVTVNVKPVAVDDAFTLGTNLANQPISVNANDLCSGCTLTLGTLSGSGVDAISVDGGSVRVTTSADTGIATFTYTLTTATGNLTDTATVTITVSNASPDKATTSAGTPLTIDVIANDALNNTNVSAVSGLGASVGTATFDGVNLTFTPEANFAGLAQFTYTTAGGTSASVSVLVAPSTLSFTTLAGVSVSGIVLIPAVCPGCEVTVVTGSDAGDLEPNGDGTFTFTPAVGFSGTNSDLRYEIYHEPTDLRVLGTVEVEVTAPLISGLALTTSISGDATVGALATVTYIVTNSATATLSAVTLMDPLVTSVFTCVPGLPINEFAPDAVATCTATFVITQAHLDAGSDTSVASVSATSAVDGVDDPVTVSATSTLTLSSVPSISISASVPSNVTVSAVGDIVPVTYTIVNDGPLTLGTLALAVSQGAVNCSGGLAGSLAPGASAVCVVSYPVTQGDLDISEFTHAATVSGQSVQGVQVSALASVVVLFTIESPQTNQNDPPAQNPPPAAPQMQINDDSVSAPMGAIISILPLTNDVGNNLQITSITPPTAGFAQLQGGTVILTPPLFHLGPIDITYTATDGQNSGTARIIVTMTDTGALLLPEMFLDLNRNGRRDVNEPGIGQVQMTLGLTGRAELIAQGDGSLRLTRMTTSSLRSMFGLMATATGGCTTDTNGVCSPPSMPAGSYILNVTFDPESHGLEMTAFPPGTIGLTSGLDLSGLEEMRPAFGFAGPGTIVVQVDPDQEVEIVWAGDDGEFGTDDDVIIVAKGDSNGQISVPGLPKGRYLIRAVGSGTPLRFGVNGVELVQIDARGIANAVRLPAVGSDAGFLGLIGLTTVTFGLMLVAITATGSRRRRVQMS